MISNLPLITGIVLLGYVLTSILKIKKGFGPVLSIAASMAVLEIGGAFGILWPVANIYCIAVCGLFIAYIAKTRNSVDMKAYFLNPSIIGFLFAALFYMIVSSGETLFYTREDSFLHWGMFSKAVFYNHNLDIWNSNLDVNHNVYPHGMASWYSLFALGKSSYTERDVMLSINVLLFASSCPIIDIAHTRIRKLLPGKRVMSLIVYFVSGMCVASLLWIWRFAEWSYTSGYMDIPLGAAFMASLCLAVTDSTAYYRKAFGVSLLAAMLVMIKPSGIIFVGTVCMVYLINEYISNGFHLIPNDICKLFRGGGVSISIPLLELGIWNAMMKYLGITGGDQFRLKGFLPSTVIARYQSDTAYAEVFPVVIRNFFTVFFTRGVAFFRLSAFGWMALCIVIAVFMVIFQKEHCRKGIVLYVNICMLLFFCLYNLFLLWTYLTTMSKDEALGIVCYDRYIGSYIIGWFVLCIYLLFFYNVGTPKIQYLYFTGFFLCNIFGFLDRNTYLKEIDPAIKEIYELSNSIKECIPEKPYNDSEDMPDLWISYAHKKESLNSEQITQLRYYLFPDFDFIKINGIQENYNREMKDIVAEFSFDYVVLYGVNEDFYHTYYWFFSDGLSNAIEQYENGHYQAYKVIRDEITNEFRWFEPIL